MLHPHRTHVVGAYQVLQGGTSPTCEVLVAAPIFDAQTNSSNEARWYFTFKEGISLLLELEKGLATDCFLHLSDVLSEAWNNLEVDDILWSSGSMDKGEALLLCHVIALAMDKGAYPSGVVVVVTTQYAQMVWFGFCV